ncbi:hypothetical protein IWX50DRAFT_631996, partial [Phyllosticta citricarpa]
MVTEGCRRAAAGLGWAGLWLPRREVGAPVAYLPSVRLPDLTLPSITYAGRNAHDVCDHMYKSMPGTRHHENTNVWIHLMSSPNGPSLLLAFCICPIHHRLLNATGLLRCSSSSSTPSIPSSDALRPGCHVFPAPVAHATIRATHTSALMSLSSRNVVIPRPLQQTATPASSMPCPMKGRKQRIVWRAGKDRWTGHVRHSRFAALAESRPQTVAEL